MTSLVPVIKETNVAKKKRTLDSIARSSSQIASEINRGTIKARQSSATRPSHGRERDLPNCDELPINLNFTSPLSLDSTSRFICSARDETVDVYFFFFPSIMLALIDGDKQNQRQILVIISYPPTRCRG